MDRKPPRTGLFVLLVAACAGAVGFLAGRFGPGAPDSSPARGVAPAIEARWREVAQPDEAWLFEREEAKDAPSLPPPAASGEPEGPPPSQLIASLREHRNGERAQKILQGMIADAARAGGPILPELKELLDSGEDIRFTGYDAKEGGYPTLRVALLAAAEATGDPAATEMIAEVTQTSESPVEVVFGAHLLDRLDALDAPTAQRALDSLQRPLTDDQRKAMGPVVGRVVPAAAGAAPEYAESMLLTQIRAEDHRNLRMLMPALKGLPEDRARNLVLTTVTAGDVHERNKRWVAGQAARRRELGMLSELRQAIESNVVSPKVATTVAHGSIWNREYGRLFKRARKAARSGDLAEARQLATQYHARLSEAQRTVQAARNSGAKINPIVDTTAKQRRQQLDQLRAEIRRRAKALAKKQAQDG